MSRAIMIILDGLGVGGAPDAAEYGDAGSDTLGNMAKHVGGVNTPHLGLLGLGNVSKIQGIPPVPEPSASYGRMEEVSAGKDSTTGHWELMGIVINEPFPTYPTGFPDEVIEEFTRLTGYGVLGNKPASGTAIMEELGDEHLHTGKLIVYTSADSVFQIAAHDQVCSLEELYRVCGIARKMLVPPNQVSRVIARPFSGPSGGFFRTVYRHDYSLDPPSGLLLPTLQEHGVRVLAIGKINDLYSGCGIDEALVSRDNAQGMEELGNLYLELTEGSADDQTLILINLVDFDMLWGHRNDPAGMKRGLEEFDRWLGDFLPRLIPGDLLLLTADHGNDPTTPSTDHSREHVPILAYLAGSGTGANLGVRKGFMDVAATLAEYFEAPRLARGRSFLGDLKESDST
ncbi:MAG: phosphopentomutase [Gemmatimonadales bacterium]|nr:phosphopentomutase [Gemmatimonadales bacterium]